MEEPLEEEEMEEVEEGVIIHESMNMQQPIKLPSLKKPKKEIKSMHPWIPTDETSNTQSSKRLWNARVTLFPFSLIRVAHILSFLLLY